MMQFDGIYRFLSNFVDCICFLDGIQYKSVEHAYQAAKTTDSETRARFKSITAAESKRLGRTVTMRPDWETVKDDVMFALLEQKFSELNPSLKVQLLGTKDLKLVEGNYWHDNYWGSCYCAKCGDNGQNKLGKMLMQIRAEAGGTMDKRVFVTTNSLNIMFDNARTIGFVGSRACTQVQLKRLGIVAGYCAVFGKRGISGGCEGADQTAANKYVQYGRRDNFHIHMPWKQYCSKHVVPEGMSWDCWKNGDLPEDLKADALWLAGLHDKNRAERYPHMMGRNALIVMGSDILVYAINGDSAGTTHDVNIANDIGVPTINVSHDETWRVVYQFIKDQKEWLDYQEFLAEGITR